MANPYPSGEGETRGLEDAQGPNQSPVPIFDRPAHARKNNAVPDRSIINLGHQDGEIHLQRSIHDMKDMKVVTTDWSKGNDTGDTVKRSI